MEHSRLPAQFLGESPKVRLPAAECEKLERAVKDELQIALTSATRLDHLAQLVARHGVPAVAEAVLELGTDVALTAAHEMARDARSDVRAAGVRALIDFRTSVAQEHLFDVLVTTPDEATRALALQRVSEEPPAGVHWMCMESPARPDYEPGAQEALVELLAEAIGFIEVRNEVVTAVRDHGDLLGARALARSRPTTARSLGMQLRSGAPLQRICAALLLRVGSTAAINVVFPLRELCRDKESSVGAAAAESLLTVDPQALPWARKTVESASGARPGLRVMGAAAKVEDLPCVAALVARTDLRKEAHDALRGFARESVVALARSWVSGGQERRLAASRMLGTFGLEMDIPALELLSNDVDRVVCDAAFEGLCQRAPEVATLRAHEFLTGPHSQRAVALLATRADDQGHDMLCDHAWSPQIAWGTVANAISDFTSDRARAVVGLHQLAGGPRDTLHDAVRQSLAGELAEAGVRELTTALAKADPARHPAIVRGVLSIPGPAYVPALIDYYSEQPRNTWAAEILEGLADKPHPRVVQEVLVALGEREAAVREKAQWLLRNRPVGDRPVEVWGAFLEMWRRLCEWTEMVSWEFLGTGTWLKPVRDGVGLTWFRQAHDGSADVEVTVQPLLDGREEAWDVVRGVVIHEFGHHIYDFRQPGFKSANGNAQAAGVAPIFDLLLDERLERNLRAHDPFYGTLIDRANAYFRESPPIRVTAAEVIECVGEEAARVWAQRTGLGLDDGVLTLSAWDAALIPNLLPRLDAFFVGLLVVRNPARFADAKVREALELVPANLKDCTHGDLFRLSVAVGELLDVRDNGAAASRQRQRARGRLGRLVQSAVGKAGAATGVGTSGTTHTSAARASVQAAKALRAKLARPRIPRVTARLAPTAKASGGQGLNTSADVDFPELRHEIRLEPDLDGFRKLVRANRRYVSSLRRHFELLGSREVDLRAQTRGHRLDVGQVRRLVTQPTTRLLVRHDDDLGANAYIGLLIDRSGSMQGEKIALARRFAALLAESAGGVRGLSGHVSAFDDDTFYRLGDFRRNAIARLVSGGGNNDAGGLLRAAQLALQSGRDNRLLVMISDGSPTECSVAALANLVRYLGRRRNVACAQVCVDRVRDRVFPVTLDVRELGMDAAAHEFGRLLVRLTRTWR